MDDYAAALAVQLLWWYVQKIESYPHGRATDYCLSLQVGFCTLYTFYAYPDTRRFRLSQILVLPPFQHKGIGAALLRAAYVMADKCSAVDVTVSLTVFCLF